MILLYRYVRLLLTLLLTFTCYCSIYPNSKMVPDCAGRSFDASHSGFSLSFSPQSSLGCTPFWVLLHLSQVQRCLMPFVNLVGVFLPTESAHSHSFLLQCWKTLSSPNFYMCTFDSICINSTQVCIHYLNVCIPAQCPHFER